MITDFLLGGAIVTGLTVQAMTTTSSISDGGGSDGIATTLATTYTAGLSIGVSKLADIDKIKEKLVHDSLSYVESMDEEQLAKLESILIEKGLEFEISDQTETLETPKVFVKNNDN